MVGLVQNGPHHLDIFIGACHHFPLKLKIHHPLVLMPCNFSTRLVIILYFRAEYNIMKIFSLSRLKSWLSRKNIEKFTLVVEVRLVSWPSGASIGIEKSSCFSEWSGDGFHPRSVWWRWWRSHSFFFFVCEYWILILIELKSLSSSNDWPKRCYISALYIHIQ